MFTWLEKQKAKVKGTKECTVDILPQLLSSHLLIFYFVDYVFGTESKESNPSSQRFYTGWAWWYTPVIPALRR
jgi:hypothetical protein